MSADNGIYVAIFGDGKARVVEASGIDNCWNRENDTENADVIVDVFGDAKEFENSLLSEVYEYARELEQQIVADFGFTEYGICSYHFQHPFSYYLAETHTLQHNEEESDEIYDVENDPWGHTDV